MRRPGGMRSAGAPSILQGAPDYLTNVNLRVWLTPSVSSRK